MEMDSARGRYLHDPEYRMLIDTLEQCIERAQFTPSEVRQAAIQACIHYEARRPPSVPFTDD